MRNVWCQHRKEAITTSSTTDPAKNLSAQPAVKKASCESGLTAVRNSVRKKMITRGQLKRRKAHTHVDTRFRMLATIGGVRVTPQSRRRGLPCETTTRTSPVQPCRCVRATRPSGTPATDVRPPARSSPFIRMMRVCQVSRRIVECTTSI